MLGKNPNLRSSSAAQETLGMSLNLTENLLLEV